MINLRELPPLNPENPPAEPVTLAEARAQVRADDGGSADDAMLASLITASRQAAESFTGRLFTAARYELRVDAFDGAVCLPVAPVGAVSSVQYLDAASVLQTLGAGLYYFDDHPDAPRLIAQPGASFPAPLAMPGSVRVVFTGPDVATYPVPRAAVQAMLLIIGHLYAHREDVVTEGAAVDLPQGSKSLLWPYRRGLGV